MNTYRFKDLTIGTTESFDITITDDMMSEFRDLSGDTNPLHTDVNYAKTMGYDSCVVYGMLTASLLSKLGGCISLVRIV